MTESLVGFDPTRLPETTAMKRLYNEANALLCFFEAWSGADGNGWAPTNPQPVLGVRR